MKFLYAIAALIFILLLLIFQRHGKYYTYVNLTSKVFSFIEAKHGEIRTFSVCCIFRIKKYLLKKKGYKNSTSNFFGPLVCYLAEGMGVVSLWSYSTRSAAYGKMARE